VTDTGEEDEGRAFLTEWVSDHGLADAELLIETGDVETLIENLGAEYSLVIVGATERGLLSRIIRGSLVFDTIETLDVPVLLTERPSGRSLRERLVGRR
jgi:nucleotide-binding universal stress UspA family protein